TLTAAGKRLLAGADRILAEAQAFQAEAQALKGGISGRARLGTLSDPDFIRLGDFMNVAVERYPQLEIDFQHEITGVALQRVRDATLEASFYYGNMPYPQVRSEEHTSELQSLRHLVCRLLLEKKKSSPS